MKRTILALALTLLLSGAAPAQSPAGSDPAESNVTSNETSAADLSTLIVIWFTEIAIPNLLKT